MAGLLLNTGTASFSDLIGNGKTYRVPPYQRDYSWEAEEWEDLWYDILDLPTEKKHYMGYVVLQQIDENDKTFWIIDGQQRFTTLSILCLAGISLLKKWANDNIDKEDNITRQEKLTEKFLGNFSSSKLTLTSKLFLNQNNDDFYQSYLLQHRKPTNIAKLKPSQKKLWQAYNFFVQKIQEKITSENGATLAEFIEDTISNNLIFTTINVSDDLNAYKVFETLNARGVKLSPADLIKNYLFSVAVKSSETDLKEAERRWQSINDILNKGDLPTYIRHFWNSRNDFVRSANLFRAIKNNKKTPNEVFNLLNDLELNVTIYAAFENPGDSLWTKEQRNYIKVLNLFGVTQCYPLLLIAKEKFTEQEYIKLLHELVVITFRYNIISGLNPNEIEKIINKTSVKVSNNDITNAAQIFQELRSVYVSDENFAQAFATKELSTKRNKNLSKYILVELENSLSGTNLQYEDAMATIEHILPENPGSIWDDAFEPNLQDEFIYLLGNYTLLEESKNKKLDNETSFMDKLKVYKTSQYKICEKELNYDNWTPVVLRSHQEKMARWACNTWKSFYIQNHK